MIVFLKPLQVAVFTDRRKSAERSWILSKQGLLLLILALSKSPQTVEGSKGTLWSVCERRWCTGFDHLCRSKSIFNGCSKSKPFCYFTIWEHLFSHCFVKWSPAKNAKLCSAMKIVKYNSAVVTCSLSDWFFWDSKDVIVAWFTKALAPYLWHLLSNVASLHIILTTHWDIDYRCCSGHNLVPFYLMICCSKSIHLSTCIFFLTSSEVVVQPFSAATSTYNRSGDLKHAAALTTV